VRFSRTAHSGEWDAHISIQNREAAHQYHCQGHHFLTAEIKKCESSNRPLPVVNIHVFWDVTTHQLVQLPAFQMSIVILQGKTVQILVDHKDENNILFQNVCTYLAVNTAIIILYLLILNAIYGHATVVYCQCIIFIWYDTNTVCHFM